MEDNEKPNCGFIICELWLDCVTVLFGSVERARLSPWSYGDSQEDMFHIRKSIAIVNIKRYKQWNFKKEKKR